MTAVQINKIIVSVSDITSSKLGFLITYILTASLPSGPKRNWYARDLGFDSQVEQSVIGFFYEILSTTSELGFVPG